MLVERKCCWWKKGKGGSSGPWSVMCLVPHSVLKWASCVSTSFGRWTTFLQRSISSWCRASCARNCAPTAFRCSNGTSGTFFFNSTYPLDLDRNVTRPLVLERTSWTPGLWVPCDVQWDSNIPFGRSFNLCLQSYREFSCTLVSQSETNGVGSKFLSNGLNIFSVTALGTWNFTG
jgi:hypothetical protein